MNRSEFLSAFDGRSERIPVWFMRQAGRYLPAYREIRKTRTIKEICSDPALISRVTYSPISDVGVDAAIIFFDITLPLEAMGYRVDFEERVGPIISSREGDRGRINYDVKNDRNSLYDGIKAFRSEHPDTFLYGFTGGPITLASYILAGGSDRDLTRTISSILKDRNAFKDLMDDILEMIISTAKAQVRSGADAIQVFDSWAGSLPYSMFSDYVNDYLIPLSSELSAIRTVYFSTRTAGYAHLLSSTEFMYLSMDSRCRLSGMDKIFQSSKGLQGNLDPLYTATDTKIAVRETEKILDDARNIDRYVFNLGHGVLPETSVECLKQIIRTVHEYGR